MSRYDDSLVLGMLEVENELEGEKQEGACTGVCECPF